MKKVISLLIIMMLAVVAGCGAPTPSKPGETTSEKANGDTKEITVAGNGGVIERAVRDIIAPKFEKDTGIKVNYIAGLSGEILSKVELQKNAPKIDVAFFVPVDVKRAQDKDLITPINETNVENMKQVDQRFIPLENTAAPAFGLVIAPAYNTESFKKNNMDIS